MGRKVQTIRKKRILKSKQKFDDWMKKKSNPRWQSVASYKSIDRFWIVTKEPICGLVMVDKEEIQDHEGDDVYRIVYSVDATGEVSEKYGFVNVFNNKMLLSSQIQTVVSEDIAIQLDKWIKTAKEGVEFTHPSGFVDTKVDLKPCPVKVPGWKHITKAQQTATNKKFASNLAALVMSGALD